MILDISNAEYHLRSELSNSQIKLFGRSPLHYKSGSSSIGFNTARIGTATHSSVLENWKDVVVIKADRKRSSKEDRTWWQDYFKEEHGVDVDTSMKAETWLEQFEAASGKTVVTFKEHKDISAMNDSIRSNDLAASLLEDIQPEMSIINKVSGVDCRVRPDGMNVHYMLDVKTTEDASERGFQRACQNYEYHRQDDFYSRLHSEEHDGDWPDFYFIAVEKKFPFACAVYQLHRSAKQNAHWLNDRDLKRFKECFEKNSWPGYSNNNDLTLRLFDTSYD